MTRTSYAAGWKRSAAFHREQNARDQRWEGQRNAGERAIVAAEFIRAVNTLPGKEG